MKGAEEKRARGNKYKASAVPIPLLLWSLESGLSLCCFFWPLLGIDDGKSRRSFQAGTRRAVAVGRKRTVSPTHHQSFFFFFVFFFVWPFLYCSNTGEVSIPHTNSYRFRHNWRHAPPKKGRVLANCFWKKRGSFARNLRLFRHKRKKDCPPSTTARLPYVSVICALTSSAACH